MSKLNIFPYITLYLVVCYFMLIPIYSSLEHFFHVNVNVYRLLFYPALLLFIFIGLLNFNKIFIYVSKNTNIKFVIFLMIYVILYILYYKFFVSLPYINDNVLWFQSKIVYYALVNFAFGVLFMLYIRHKAYPKFFMFSYSLYVIFLSIMFYFYKSIGSGLHQLFGDTFAIFSLLVILFTSSMRKQFFILILGLFFLYLIGSRASFYAYLVVYMFFLFKFLGTKKFAITMAIIFILSLSLYSTKYLFVNERMFGVLEGKYDSSLNERIEIFQYGIKSIEQNWFFGDFAGQNRVHEIGYKSGSMGAYIHNFLSFWRQFGLIFFIIFNVVYFRSLIKIFLHWYKNTNRDLTNDIFYLSLFMTIELLLFRSYATSYIWFVLGIMIVATTKNTIKFEHVKA